MRMKWLAKFLYPRMMALAASRHSDFDVQRDGDKEIYLQRWWVIPRNKFFNIYLHHMIRDDDPILHDHMYVSVSLMLRGRLHEFYKLTPEEDFETHQDLGGGPLSQRLFIDSKLVRVVVEGDVVWRSSRMAHQLLVKDPDTWTLFVTGPRIKSWGFWCPKGWREWKDYVAISQNPDGSGKGLSGRGVGCGEMS